MHSQGEPGGAAATQRPKILIVEDNVILAMNIEDQLTEEGFEVVGIATTADQAIILAEKHKPALAVMDIRLAGARDGIDAAIQLKSQFGIRSVIASAHSAPEMRERAHAAEPAGWLTKPYVGRELAAVLRAALQAKS
ncbi:MAG: response regulator [Rhodospirillaceae bacterium]